MLQFTAARAAYDELPTTAVPLWSSPAAVVLQPISDHDRNAPAAQLNATRRFKFYDSAAAYKRVLGMKQFAGPAALTVPHVAALGEAAAVSGDELCRTWLMAEDMLDAVAEAKQRMQHAF
jgi:hypothetical protein